MNEDLQKGEERRQRAIELWRERYRRLAEYRGGLDRATRAVLEADLRAIVEKPFHGGYVWSEPVDEDAEAREERWRAFVDDTMREGREEREAERRAKEARDDERLAELRERYGR